MQTTLSSQPITQTDTDALVFPLFEEEAAPASIGPIAGAWLDTLKGSGEFTGKTGELAMLYQPAGFQARRLAVFGCGKRDKFNPAELRRAAGSVVRALKSRSILAIAFVLENADAASVEAAVEGAILGNYEPDRYKTTNDKKSVERFTVVVPVAGDGLAAALARAAIIAESQNFTRDLVGEPSNRLTPLLLAGRARQMADEAGLDCEVLDQDRMRQLGMGALLGVAQGSEEPPALIVVRYRPSTPSSSDHLGLVGKGVTFDSGGISIKPAEGMDRMKSDMAGGAAMLGAMRAIAQLKPSIPVTAFVPAVENMVSGRAQRPGDIVTALSGKTIEVLNTDAEGRLILADALTYARRQGCTHLVDAATLTGAVVVALGYVNVGAFTNNDALLAKVLSAAKSEGEKMWHMPLEEDYKEQLKSPYADLANIGGRPGGSITAAWFLREFAEDTPWVHLDIAGTAWLEDTKPYAPKGPTGVAVRTFVRLALDW